MDHSKNYDNPSPENTADIFSKWFFIWTFPLFKIGYKNDLQPRDLYNTTKDDLAEPIGDIMEGHWDTEVQTAKETGCKPSLLRVIKKTFIKTYSYYGILLFIQVIGIRTFQPVVLGLYINYFNPTNTASVGHAWCLALLVIFMSFFNILIAHNTQLGQQRLGMRCRIACSSLIYRKLLKMSKTALNQTTSGQIVNLLSNDVARFEDAPVFLHYVWLMPVQAGVSAFLMTESVGFSAICGLMAMILQAVPLQGKLAEIMGHMRLIIARRTDERIRLMSEITNGIRVIKMYAWEKPFEKLVQISRKLEIKEITKTSYIRGFSIALCVYSERATLYITLVTYVLLGNRLTADKVFSMAQFFNCVQLYMAIFYPFALSAWNEAKISVSRIEEFLEKDEVVRPLQLNGMTMETEKYGHIELKNAKASWIVQPIFDTLSNLTFTIKPNTLCAIVGPVGSGKSSLLQLLLNELPLNSGKLNISGSVSYASQDPWLFVSSIRNNILFGLTYHRERYKDVVKVCALERDFQLFPNGDKTLVGERGVSLSGGQRARINLARAIYRQTDIYLLDDPLSAVDPHVGKHIFNECIKTYLNGKTRILITHQLQYLKDVDVIIIINNGQVQRVGSYEELADDELLQHLKTELHPEDANEIPIDMSHNQIGSQISVNADSEENEEPKETQELMEKGSLSGSLYMQYLRAGGSIGMLLLLLFGLLIAQAASSGADYWIAYWTNQEEIRYYLELQNVSLEENSTASNDYDFTTFMSTIVDDLYTNTESSSDITEYTTDSSFENTTFAFYRDDASFINSTADENDLEVPIDYVPRNFTNSPKDFFSQSTYIWIYTLFILGSIILTTLRSLLFFKICMTASRNLHDIMFSNILQATMRFFDSNPSGRILTRFSKDMGSIDEILPKVWLEALQIFLVMSGILSMVLIVNVWMIIPTLIMGILFQILKVIYISTAQDLKRLDGIGRGPVYSHVSASLDGLITIRTCKSQFLVRRDFDNLQDQNTASFFLFTAVSCAFGFYLDLICIVYLTIVTLQFLILDDGTTLSGNVGLVISQSLILTGMLQYGIRQTALVQSQMTSVERILQYTKLEKESSMSVATPQKPHRDWPNEGKIKFQDINLRYNPEDPPVLKNLNFEIAAAQKIGIVGRTGAGKSSLISALFHLTPIEGKITIDNVDIKSIGLNDLRQSISIIPQEPVLFCASLRYNLDPFDKNNDDVLWQALEDVELKDAIESLDQEVSEGGSNFSVGQRQLMCLARAIIRKNKIIVMDEATANVDLQTDALIQATMRKKFNDCTVLTIAHRLNTIMDADKVLVMQAGEIVEFGHPHELLQNSDGPFSKMLRDSGKNNEKKLKEVAERSYDKTPTNSTDL